MYASPQQQNRALLLALAINAGFILLMALTIAWMGQAWEALILVLLLVGLYGLVIAALLLRRLRRRHRLTRASRQWLELSEPPALE
jgi:O-antigen/teichoic acid export membrane protein